MIASTIHYSGSGVEATPHPCGILSFPSAKALAYVALPNCQISPGYDIDSTLQLYTVQKYRKLDKNSLVVQEACRLIEK